MPDLPNQDVAVPPLHSQTTQLLPGGHWTCQVRSASSARAKWADVAQSPHECWTRLPTAMHLAGCAWLATGLAMNKAGDSCPMQARVRLGWRLHEAASDSMPVTSLCSGMRRALLYCCLFAIVFEHAAPPHLNEAPPSWPAWGLSSFAVYSGSDSSPPLGMAAGGVPQAPKVTLAGRLQMLTPLDVGWCTLASAGPVLLYTVADDLQLKTAPEVWCAPSCRPAPEGAAMLDRHHGTAWRSGLHFG